MKRMSRIVKIALFDNDPDFTFCVVRHFDKYASEEGQAVTGDCYGASAAMTANSRQGEVANGSFGAVDFGDMGIG